MSNRAVTVSNGLPVTVSDGFEHRAASVLAKRNGRPADKVQQLIDLYAQHPADAEVSVSEVIENLRVLKRCMVRR